MNVTIRYNKVYNQENIANEVENKTEKTCQVIFAINIININKDKLPNFYYKIVDLIIQVFNLN